MRRFFRWNLTQAGWFVAAVCLFASAVYTLVLGPSALLEATFPIGLSMLLSGLINVWIYHINRHKLHGSHWLFADGMSTALLSIFWLSHIFCVMQGSGHSPDG